MIITSERKWEDSEDPSEGNLKPWLSPPREGAPAASVSSVLLVAYLVYLMQSDYINLFIKEIITASFFITIFLELLFSP